MEGWAGPSTERKPRHRAQPQEDTGLSEETGGAWAGEVGKGATKASAMAWHLGHILKYMGATATGDHRAVTAQLFSGQWGWELGQETVLLVILLLSYCDHTPHALHTHITHVRTALTCTHTYMHAPHTNTHTHLTCTHTVPTYHTHIQNYTSTHCTHTFTQTRIYTCYTHTLTPHSTHSAPTHHTHTLNIHNLQPPLHCTHTYACPAPRTLYHTGVVLL